MYLILIMVVLLLTCTLFLSNTKEGITLSANMTDMLPIYIAEDNNSIKIPNRLEGNLNSGALTFGGDVIPTRDVLLSATSKLKVGGYNALPPVGSMMSFLGTEDPDGWVICNGVSRANNGRYNALIEMGIGLREGSNYKPPDLRERVLKAGTVKEMGAAPTLTLTEAQMPAHSHAGTTDSMNQNWSHQHRTTDGTELQGITNEGHCTEDKFDWSPGEVNQCTDEWKKLRNNVTSWTDINHGHTFTTNSKGSGAVINLPPPLSYGVNYIVKY